MDSQPFAGLPIARSLLFRLIRTHLLIISSTLAARDAVNGDGKINLKKKYLLEARFDRCRSASDVPWARPSELFHHLLFSTEPRLLNKDAIQLKGWGYSQETVFSSISYCLDILLNCPVLGVQGIRRSVINDCQSYCRDVLPSW